MADYTLPQYVTSRVRYYDGEYLKDDEFIDEQKYHIDRRQRHDRLLHVAGVCEGLLPSKVDAKSLKVSAGTAIDDLGQTILVNADQTILVPSDQNGALNIVITFVEKEDRPADVNAVGSNTRFTQAPALQLSAASIAHGVVIGQALVVSGSLSQVTMTNRVYSGLRLPGPGGAAYALHSRGGDAAPGVVDMESSLNVTGGLTVAGALAIGATDASGSKLRVAGNTLLGGDVQVTGSRLKNNTGLGIVETNAADWLRVNPDGGYPGIALYKNVAIGSGGLAIGEWSQQPTGTLKVTGKATFSVGAVANGLNLGTSGAQATYAFPYESLGTDNPNQNLRLISGNAIFTHAAKGFTVSKDQGGSGDLGVEGALSFGASVRQMVNLWNANYGVGVQSGTLYFRTDKNVAFYKAGAHDNAELSAGAGGAAMLVINNGNVGIGTATPEGILHAVGNLVLGTDENNKKFVFHPRTGTGDFLQITHDGADGGWSWGTGITLKRGGNVGIGTTDPQAALHVSGGTFRLGDWRLETSGGTLTIKYGDQVIARFSNGRDKIQIYRNNNGASPYFYYNDAGDYGRVT